MNDLNFLHSRNDRDEYLLLVMSSVYLGRNLTEATGSKGASDEVIPIYVFRRLYYVVIQALRRYYTDEQLRWF